MPEGTCNIIQRGAGKQTDVYECVIGVWQTGALACGCVSYLGGHDPVIAELGWNESLIVGRGPMTNADIPTVHSSFIAAKLQDEAPEAWWRWDEIKIEREKRGHVSNPGYDLSLKQR